MSGVIMAVCGGAGSFQISFAATLSNVGSSSGGYAVSVTLNSDGTASHSGTGTASTNWAVNPSAGIGSLVWVKAGAPDGGGTTNYTAGTWYSLSSAILLSVHNSSPSTEQAGGIALVFATDSAGGNVIGSGTFSYDVGDLGH